MDTFTSWVEDEVTSSGQQVLSLGGHLEIQRETLHWRCVEKSVLK